MRDYSQYGVPRPVEIGRKVGIERRRSTTRALLFAAAGFLTACVCLCAAVALIYGVLGPAQGRLSLNLPQLGGPSATATPAGPTPVPYGKSAKNGDGLRVTLAAYQRPLPAQGVDVPKGQELVLITLKLDNTRTTGDPLAFSPQDFRLVSPEGDDFAPDTQGLTTGDVLREGQVAPGKTVKGDLIYYVYSDVKDLMLEWAQANGSAIDFKLTRP